MFKTFEQDREYLENKYHRTDILLITVTFLAQRVLCICAGALFSQAHIFLSKALPSKSSWNSSDH